MPNKPTPVCPGPHCECDSCLAGDILAGGGFSTGKSQIDSLRAQVAEQQQQIAELKKQLMWHVGFLASSSATVREGMLLQQIRDEQVKTNAAVIAGNQQRERADKAERERDVLKDATEVVGLMCQEHRERAEAAEAKLAELQATAGAGVHPEGAKDGS